MRFAASLRREHQLITDPWSLITRRRPRRNRRCLIPVIDELPNGEDCQNDGDPRDDLAGARRVSWQHPPLLGKRVDALSQGEIELSQAALAVGCQDKPYFVVADVDV